MDGFMDVYSKDAKIKSVNIDAITSYKDNPDPSCAVVNVKEGVVVFRYLSVDSYDAFKSKIEKYSKKDADDK